MRNSLDDIWNSAELRSIRRDMVQGRVISGCIACYELEAAGYPSDRTFANQKWAAGGWDNDELLTLEQFKARAVADDFRHRAPAFVELHLGNLCNLKCRMCFGHSSTRIARDPVHMSWLESDHARGLHLLRQSPWWQERAVLESILQQPDAIRELYLMGGEPLLIKEAGDVLQLLVDRGAAPHIHLVFSTNGTVVRPPWIRLLREFKSVCLSVSIDGYGKLNDYMRYPARWDTLLRNLETFRAMPNMSLTVGAVLQAYNALNFVELLRFCDSMDLGYLIFVLDNPDHLRTEVLPPRVRRLAAERLRAYADRDCKPGQKDFIVKLAEGLESYGDVCDEERLRKFLLFTHDLDLSRGQSLMSTCPELCQLIADSGLRWTSAGLLAERNALEARHRELEARYQELKLNNQHAPLTSPSGRLCEIGRRGLRKVKGYLSGAQR